MSSNVSNFPALGRRIQKSNAGPESLHLHSDEKLVLDVYFKGGFLESSQLAEVCNRLDVPEIVECSRLTLLQRGASCRVAVNRKVQEPWAS
jgi:hypothetical protein